MKIECPFCRSKISDEAVVCPYCQAEKIVFEREIKPNYIKTLLQAVLTPIFAS
jgi:DNA-directed RNA polymerase subunit RPC12/RpoP